MKQYGITFFSVLVLLGICCLPGCGGRKDLNSISGTVLLGKEPLKCGTITFVPMDAGGKDAPTPPTSIGIVEGKYEIDKEWGLKQGKYRVTIKGFEGQQRGDQLLGMPICSDFKTVFDYTGQATNDFQLPALKKPMRTVSDKELDRISSKAD